MDMSIAAMSVNMHQGQAMQDMGMAVLKMAMDTTEVAAEEMLEELAVVFFILLCVSAGFVVSFMVGSGLS